MRNSHLDCVIVICIFIGVLFRAELTIRLHLAEDICDLSSTSSSAFLTFRTLFEFRASREYFPSALLLSQSLSPCGSLRVPSSKLQPLHVSY
ncbi:hypothetical protein B9Z55_028170 [Caenorhabditis nigoni]|uniref:Uncharacterized protein n=1 Tax=Caenorhabditis nigoni TaxID=1611254 RepID=A0A2G5SCQ2_9PELO|nr:hypothetical protein B9Z55_028170 [Caenorhabditis nigoni]